MSCGEDQAQNLEWANDVKHCCDKDQALTDSHRMIYLTVEYDFTPRQPYRELLPSFITQAIKRRLSSQCFTLMLKSRQIISALGSILSLTPSFFLGWLLYTASPVLQNYHLTHMAVGQIAAFASSTVALILGLESLRFELWFHFGCIEKINSDSSGYWGKCTTAKYTHGHASVHVTGGWNMRKLHDFKMRVSYIIRWLYCVYL